MRNRDLLLSLAEFPDEPLGRRVLLTLRRAIREGRIPVGSALPGSRVLSAMLGVHRQTVIAAIQDLTAEGLLETLPNRGTFVTPPTPGMEEPQDADEAPAMGFDVPSFLRPVSSMHPNALLLADGAADPRLAPADALARGYRRALSRHGTSLLQDRDPLGNLLLREMVADWVSERQGLKVGPERILITRGSRGALALIIASLLKHGDAVGVENPGNRGAWEIFTSGSRHPLVPLAVDARGLVPGALEEALARTRIRALYVTPRRQFPTAASMDRGRALEVLEIAARHRMMIIEDDYDGEFSYQEMRPRPLISEDPGGQVVHIGSLSRLFAPGLRLGYLILPQPLASLVGRVKGIREEQGDPAFEWAVGDLIRDGDLARHVRKVTRIYEARRDFLVGELGKRLGGFLRVEPPEGGMGVWVTATGVDAEGWVREARKQGLVLSPPSRFFLENPLTAFRMGFSQAEEPELAEAVACLARAMGTLG